MKGDVEKNLKLAKFAARVLIGTGYIPIAPHLYFPQFLDDNDQYERIKGIKMGVELMKECDRICFLWKSVFFLSFRHSVRHFTVRQKPFLHQAPHDHESFRTGESFL